jgi:hypothetical protein
VADARQVAKRFFPRPGVDSKRYMLQRPVCRCFLSFLGATEGATKVRQKCNGVTGAGGRREAEGARRQVGQMFLPPAGGNSGTTYNKAMSARVFCIF